MTARLFRLAALVAIATSASCVHQQEAPPLTGPSTIGRSLTITVSPDHITQDGTSQASVAVQAVGSNGAPLSGVAIRVDTAVDGKLVDFGTLAAHTIVTGSDGIARTVFTAPPPSLPPNDATVNLVSVQAVLSGSDAASAVPVTTSIALMPKNGILPPADTPTPAFFFFPSAPTVNESMLFDASSSCPGAVANGACAPSTATISSYRWDFNDGGPVTSASPSINHTFTRAQSYNVTLTVTNSRGVAAALTKGVSVVSGNPVPAFTFSPASPAAGVGVMFDASSTQVFGGATIVSYQWTFFGGTPGSSTSGPIAGPITFAASGSVRLTVVDSFGRQGSVSGQVPVQ